MSFGDDLLLDYEESAPVKQEKMIANGTDVEAERSDEEPDEEPDIHQGPLNTAEKRKAQRNLFKSWALSKAENITSEQIRKELGEKNDEELSIRNLLQKQEGPNKIKNPRDYQLELFERAKKENTIAVLDTGSGKTMIAVLLLRHIIDEELERRAAGLSPRISFFLVHSVNLVFQQSAVLECNLDHKVGHLCGAMRPDRYSQEVWHQHFSANEVIVCTAEVLHQCLQRAFLRMDQINVLIFDEAHHAKKEDPYAKIMQDFYFREYDKSKRPRVFGMTASPVDAKVDVFQAARDLEDLLDSKIATTESGSFVEFKSCASEQRLIYPQLPEPFETPLFQQMSARFGTIRSKMFQRLFTQAKEASSQLGAWAADKFWEFALADEQEARRAEMSVERAYLKSKDHCSMAQLDEQMDLLRQAAALVKELPFRPPRADEADLSPKVLALHDTLNRQFERPTSNKCLVFVERRQTARLLTLIFKEIGPPHLRVGGITGSNGKPGDFSQSLRQQVMTITKFRSGDVNCLFATSVAEEGLDIPECNLVIRFDLYKSMIQFVQSKGRARQQNSKFIHMVEQNNGYHEKLIQDTQSAARKMQQFCAQQPEDRLLKGSEDDIDDALRQNLDGDRYSWKHPKTGAKLTYNSSLVVLAHFCALIPTEERGLMLEPTYVISVDQGRFLCEVVMPEEAPIRSVMGHHARRKAIAKRSAAFNMCIELLRAKYLDDRLLPVYKKALPAMRNAKLALDMKKKNTYTVRVKPTLWSEAPGVIPQRLYLTVIHLSEGLDRPHQPLGLLTRSPLPKIPDFPLFLTSGKITMVTLQSLSHKTVIVDTELATKLTKVTLRVFCDVFAKVFEFAPAIMSWWIVPLFNKRAGLLADPIQLIDWPQINYISENEEFPWTPEMPNDFLHDKFFVDKYDGGRRAFTITVNPNLKANDPVPADAVQRKKHSDDILEYSNSLWKKSREYCTWIVDQPVVNAEKMLHRRNFLAAPTTAEKDLNTKVYLCPQPMRISALSTKFVATCIVFPAIIHRLEDYLIALEACNLIGVKVSAGLALEACTKDSDNSDEHEGRVEDHINFRPGMGANYERLEFMGDCFLKMAISIALYGQKPNGNEFEFHVGRMTLICNQNLFNTATGILKLPEYIRSMAFSRRLWYPEGITLLEGKGKYKRNEVQKHTLGDKSVADVCEALIGAAFIEHNKHGEWKPEQWDAAVRAVTVFVNSDDHKQLFWEDYFKTYEMPAYQTAESTASHRDLVAKVALEHDYLFRYPRLLRSAFNHPNWPFSFERIPSYQRLEFLGDSLIDMACITHLYYNYPDKDPQWLTEHKMAMVSNKFLGALCVKLGFHRHLRYNHAQLEFRIRDYVTEVQEAEKEAQGSVDYWIGVKQPPKCLPDVVESYVGAIFVDSGFNYDVVQKFFDTHIKPFFIDMSIYDTFANTHPTTCLQNVLSIELGCRDYRLMSEELPAIMPGAPSKVIAGVMVHDRIVAHAVAESGRYAKVSASLKAQDLLKGLAPFEFRQKYGCTCRPVEEDEENEVPTDMGTNI